MFNIVSIKKVQIKTTQIPSHPHQIVKHQQSKQQMLAMIQGKETFIHCWWECKLVHPLWKSVWIFLQRLKIELPYDPAVLLLSTYPRSVNQHTIKTSAHSCLRQHCSQQSSYGLSLSVHQLMNG
jgi:hypothetical protein